MYLVYLVLPLGAGALAQLIKFFIRSNQKTIKLKNLLAYSGMPSGHSAMIVSLATIVGLIEGITSPLFGVTVVLAVIVIRDALGIRRYLGQHGRTLNILVKDLSDDQVLEEHYPHHLERVGHTPIQVLAGSLLGLAVSLIGYWIWY